MFSKQEKRLIELSGHACKEYMYYAPALTRLRLEVDNESSTMSMSAFLVMRYNEEFISKIKDNDLTQLILHEILHYLSKHHQRYLQNKYRRELSHHVHNIAMDIEINQHLDSDWITKNGMTAEKFEYPKGKSYEEYLFLLKNDIDKRKQEIENESNNGLNGNDSDSNNEDNDNKSKSQKKQKSSNDKEKDDSDKPMSKDEIIDKLAKGELLRDYATICMEGMDGRELTQEDLDKLGIDMSIDELKELCNKSIGNSSGGEDILRDAPTKKYKWDVVLRNIVKSRMSKSEFGFDNQTYLKYNRRLNPQSEGIVYPSKYTEHKDFNIVVGIDVSGSMGDLVTEMYSRLKSLFGHLEEDSKVTVLECDTQILSVTTNFDWVTNKIKSHAGGGTDMEQIPKWVKQKVEKKEMEEPNLIVIMTDNCVSWDTKSLYPKKTVVLTDSVTKKCPYKQFEVEI